VRVWPEVDGQKSAPDAFGSYSAWLPDQRQLLLFAGIISAGTLFALPTSAQTWVGTTSTYQSATNWNPQNVPDSGTETATFAGAGSAVNGTKPVNVTDAITVGGWSISGASSYTITGAAVTFTGTGIVNTSSVAQSISNNIGGTGAIQQNGSGTLTLSGINSYTGATTISAGRTLKAGSAQAFSSASAFVVNATGNTRGTLDLNGFNETIGSLAGSGIVTTPQPPSVVPFKMVRRPPA
jgi:autotransporter-associated beta strand protein